MKSKEEIKQIGNKLNINWDEIDLAELTAGYEVELEHGTVNPHTNVTNDDEIMTLKIAWAHLNEIKDYYTRLAQMEKEGGGDPVNVRKEYGLNPPVGLYYPPEVQNSPEMANQSIPQKVSAVEEVRKRTPQTNNGEKYFEKAVNEWFYSTAFDNLDEDIVNLRKAVLNQQSHSNIDMDTLGQIESIIMNDYNNGMFAIKKELDNFFSKAGEAGTVYEPKMPVKRVVHNVYRNPGRHQTRVYLLPGEKPPRGLEEIIGSHGGRYYIPNIPSKKERDEEKETPAPKPVSDRSYTMEETGKEDFIRSIKKLAPSLPSLHLRGLKIVLVVGLIDGKYLGKYDAENDTAYISVLVNEITEEEINKFYGGTLSGQPWVLVLFHLLGHRVLTLKNYGMQWHKVVSQDDNAVTRFARRSAKERFAEDYMYYLKNRKYLQQHDALAAEFMDTIIFEDIEGEELAQQENKMVKEETNDLPDGSYWIEEPVVVKRIYDSLMQKGYENPEMKKISYLDDKATVQSGEPLPAMDVKRSLNDPSLSTQPAMTNKMVYLQEELYKGDSEKVAKEGDVTTSGVFNATYGKVDKAAFSPDAPVVVTGEAEKPIDSSVINENQPRFPQTPLQRKILGGIKYYEKQDLIKRFLKGYEKLCLLAKDMDIEEVTDLYYGAKEIASFKQFSIPEADNIDRLEMVIFIDAVAHNLHQEKMPDGKAVYAQLDELANLSKMMGESYRDDRIIILNEPGSAIQKLAKLNSIEILSKGNQLYKDNSLWKIFEKAIREGVNHLTDEELILTREFLYART